MKLKNGAYILKPFGNRCIVDIQDTSLATSPASIQLKHKRAKTDVSVFGYLNLNLKRFFLQFASNTMYPIRNLSDIMQDLDDFLQKNVSHLLIDNVKYKIQPVDVFERYDRAALACCNTKYKVFSILHVHDRVNHNNILQPIRVREVHFDDNEITVLVKALPESDQYIIHCDDAQDWDYAMVPDLNTSILLNRVFRNAHENFCVDHIEESDDESDDENTVTSVRMLCSYNKVFRKWKPIAVA